MDQDFMLLFTSLLKYLHVTSMIDVYYLLLLVYVIFQQVTAFPSAEMCTYNVYSIIAVKFLVLTLSCILVCGNVYAQPLSSMIPGHSLVLPVNGNLIPVRAF